VGWLPHLFPESRSLQASIASVVVFRALRSGGHMANMDYAFVPGIGDTALEVLAAQLKLRSQITVVPLVGQDTTLQVFLKVLHDGIQFMGFDQANDLILGAHGSIGGFLFMAMDASNPSPTNYETADAITTVKIPSGVGTPNTLVRLASCNLGAPETAPFLKVLKKALAAPKNVIAPRYVHSISTPDNKQFWEYMTYDFLVLGNRLGRDPLPTRDAVVGRFGAANLKFFDGSAIPLEKFESWVPPAAQITLKPTTVSEVGFDFPVTADVGGSLSIVLHATGKFRANLEKVHLVIKSNVVPVGDDVEREMLETELAKDNSYKSSHPYPVYARYDMQSLHDFVSSWNWKVTQTGSNQLDYFGTRYSYELRIPVTKPGTQDWIFNFYQEGKTPLINMTEISQPKLFGIV
jgi:hypothetical protein